MSRRIALAAAVFGVGTLLWSSASFADGALAIGLPGSNPSNGFVVGVSANRDNAEDARADAMKTCRGVDIRNTQRARAACKLIETFRNQCANDAINGDRNTPSSAVGWAVGPDSETTNARAMTMCETMRRGSGPPCHPDGDPLCDGDAK